MWKHCKAAYGGGDAVLTDEDVSGWNKQQVQQKQADRTGYGKFLCCARWCCNAVSVVIAVILFFMQVHWFVYVVFVALPLGAQHRIGSLELDCTKVDSWLTIAKKHAADAPAAADAAAPAAEQADLRAPLLPDAGNTEH